MRSFTYILSCLLIIGAYGQAPDQQVHLEISANSTIAVGTPIEIKISLVNSSKNDIDVGCVVFKMNGDTSLYLLNVRDTLNHVVPKKEYPHLELSSASAYLRTLKAGETLADSVTVNRIYDMSRPGTYSVQVGSVLPKENGGGEILSNTVKINVTDDRTR